MHWWKLQPTGGRFESYFGMNDGRGSVRNGYYLRREHSPGRKECSNERISLDRDEKVDGGRYVHKVTELLLFLGLRLIEAKAYGHGHD